MVFESDLSGTVDITGVVHVGKQRFFFFFLGLNQASLTDFFKGGERKAVRHLCFNPLTVVFMAGRAR